MTILLVKYLFLFIHGAVLGWCLELVYRRYFGKAKKWINPGFLSGPYLPLYGTGFILLYIICELDVSLVTRIILFALVTTSIEYITGLFFIKYYKTRLWDYSNLPLNIQGIIAPLYSFFWTLLAMFYYYILYPFFYSRIQGLYRNLEFSLFIGIVIGIMLIDASHSFNIMNKLKAFAELAEEGRFVINYELLKLEIRDRFEELHEKMDFRDETASRFAKPILKIRKYWQKPTFMLPFKGDYVLLHRLQDQLDRFYPKKDLKK